MRRAAPAILIVVAAALIGGYLWTRGCRAPTAPDRIATSGDRADRATAPPARADRARGDAAAGPAAGAVRRLDRVERERLGAQIAAARQRALARRRADDAGDAIDPADVVISLERVAGPLKTSLEASVPVLAECYAAVPGARRDATVLMTMTSDPDFGTVIDTGAITDGDGAALPPALDECLRDRIDALALPPLGEGGKLPLQYTFRFDDAPDAGAAER